ncbi:ATP-binding protein [Algoriphagus faecimaris]|uniref:ATP-binding protein n=1 Tax=Algoriphagus faecimaris TaxID=686796 RepID=UPI000B43B0B6|nr:ATP-binding protein [Algoriphagus faecimaris]
MLHKLKISCQTTALSELRAFMEKVLDPLCLSEHEQHQIKLAVEEVCANLIIHSHQCNEEDIIQLTFHHLDNQLIFEIQDQGEAFNMLEYEAPDLKNVIAQKRKGGLGIILVKKIMDEIQFESKSGTNICRLIKRFSS